MFTGIIESVAPVAELSATEKGGRLTLENVSFASELELGESIAVNGTCLTVTHFTPDGSVSFDLLQETLRVTNLGALRPNCRVNLERALAVGQRMSGHYVQGHIDCVSEILSITPDGNDHRLDIALPASFQHLVVHRGSIAVSGISLTIADLRDDAFTLWIIPHTMQVTNLGVSKSGDPVNLEFDVLAKYVDRLEQVRRSNPQIPA
ncbi:MAG: riboflavin synthase [Verrucomicrobiales bacterium]|jgi:riboflavin synthase